MKKLFNIVKGFITNYLSSRSIIIRSGIDPKRVKILQQQKILAKQLLVSTFFIIIQIILIVTDIVKHFISGYSFMALNVSAEIILLTSSILMFILAIYFRRKDKLNTIFIHTYIYYWIIAIGIFLYTLSDVLLQNNAYIITIFNLVILAICPLYDSRMNNIFYLVLSTVLLMTIGFGLEEFQITSFAYPIIVLLLCYLASNYYRCSETKIFVDKIILEDLAEEFKQSSITDFLTQIDNRTSLNDYIEELNALRKTEKKHLAVILFDIDDFKLYNDFYSHLAGDDCLKKIGDVLNNLRDNDFSRIFRYGGEEFLLIAEDISEAELIGKALTISKSIYDLKIDKTKANTKYPYISVSIGCFIGELNETHDFRYFLMNADRQLYHCKDNGKNCVFFADKKVD